MNEYDLPFLPPNKDIETLPILKQVAKAHRYLAELKGIAKTIPNEQILINALSLQEAKDSSEIVGVDVVQIMTNHQSEEMILHYNKTDYDTQQRRKA